MDPVNYVFSFYYLFFSEQVDKFFFCEVAVDIMRNIACFGWYHELFASKAFLFYEEVNNSVDDFFWFSKAIERAGVDHVDSSRFDTLDQRSKHLVVCLISRFSIIGADAYRWDFEVMFETCGVSPMLRMYCFVPLAVQLRKMGSTPSWQKTVFLVVGFKRVFVLFLERKVVGYSEQSLHL